MFWNRLEKVRRNNFTKWPSCTMKAEKRYLEGRCLGKSFASIAVTIAVVKLNFWNGNSRGREREGINVQFQFRALSSYYILLYSFSHFFSIVTPHKSENVSPIIRIFTVFPFEKLFIFLRSARDIRIFLDGQLRRGEKKFWMQ